MRNKDNPVGVSKQSAIKIILVMKYTLLLDAHYLFDASFLPGTRRHLLSSCALNRVHNGCKRVSKNHGIKSKQQTQWSSWNQSRKSYTGVSHSHATVGILFAATYTCIHTYIPSLCDSWWSSIPAIDLSKFPSIVKLTTVIKQDKTALVFRLTTFEGDVSALFDIKSVASGGEIVIPKVFQCQVLTWFT